MVGIKDVGDGMGEQMQQLWVWKSRARLDEQATFVQSNLRASEQTQQDLLSYRVQGAELLPVIEKWVLALGMQVQMHYCPGLVANVKSHEE
jgi:hypothetical protein